MGRGQSPLVYFRGSLEQARQLSNRDLLKAFESGFGKKAPFLGRFKIGKFKSALLQQLVELPHQAAIYGNQRIAVMDTPHGPLAFKMTHSRGRFFVHALPLSHFLTVRGIASSLRKGPLEDLDSIIRHGLKTGQPYPWFFHYENVNLQASFKDRVNFWYGAASEKPGLEGDRYGVEFFATQDRRDITPRCARTRGRVVSPLPPAGMVHRASPEGLRRVHVRLPDGLKLDDLARRHDFYLRHFGSVPFQLHVAMPLDVSESGHAAWVRVVRRVIPNSRLRFYRASAAP